MLRALVIAAMVLATACTVGPRLNRLSFPTNPSGAQASVATGRATYSGELISASDTGFVVLLNAGNRLVFVPAAMVRRVNVESLGGMSMPLRSRSLERVRLVSRHPYGIPEPAQAQMLRATGQTEIQRIEP